MQPFRRHGFLLIFLLGLLASGAIAQTLAPKVTPFPPDQYQGHAQIFFTELLPDGRRAFGTADEILVHDGESFSHIPIGKKKAAFSMDQDSTGRLYVGGSSLMGVIAPDTTGTLTFRSLQPLLPDSLKDFGNIWDTYCDGKGGVYFNAFDKLFYLKGDSMKLIRPEERFFRTHHPTGKPLIEDADTGLFMLSGSKKTYLPGSKTLVRAHSIKGILPSNGPDSTWMVFTENKGLVRYDPASGPMERSKGNEDPPTNSSLRDAKIHSAAPLDPRRNPYGAAYAVGTRLNGLYLLDPQGKTLFHVGKKAGIPSKFVLQVKTDRNGNVWAATNNGIALVHTGIPFTVAGESTGLSGAVSDIARRRDPKGKPFHSSLFLATSQGAWKWDNGKARFSKVPKTEGQCMDLHPFRFGRRSSHMLIGASYKGLLSTPDRAGEPEPAVPVDEHHAYDLSELPVNGERGVLLGGREGLHILAPTNDDPDPWEVLHSVKELSGSIRSVGWEEKPGPSDSLWIWAGGSSKGVLRIATDPAFQGHRIEHYDSGDGLPEGPVRVQDDPSEGDGGVFFGTNKGLYAFKDGSFTPYCRYGTIFCEDSRSIFDLERGTEGEVWINDATGGRIKHLLPQKKGGYRIEKTLFRALDLGPIRTIHPEKGRTWIGGDKGLACYFPNIETKIEREWDCRLREVRGSGDSLLFGGSYMRSMKKGGGDRKKVELAEKDSAINLMKSNIPVEKQPEGMVPVLPYSENRMEFAFAAAFPTRQEAVEYSYKLSDFDTAWSEWTDETKKEYTNLPEGDYTFRVKARNIYLKESRTADYRFQILPPWYRTSLAYAGYGTVGGLTLALIAWLTVRKRRADQRAKAYLEGLEKANVEIRQEKEKVEEQKEKVEEAHEEITQSIDYAQKIQYALLQSEEHISSHLPEHFILFKPYSQVSGDFYWMQEHKGSFYIAAVDCTGHGVPGAFMSMLGISQLNEIMNTDEVLTPGRILTELRDRVVRELSGSDRESAAKDGMDAAIVKIPIANSNSNSNSNSKGEEMEVQFAGAQNPLYVIRKGIAEELPAVSMEFQGEALDGDPVRPFKKSADGIEIKGDGQPVGYDEYAKEAFTTVKLSLRKGDMCYFFSDGYADQFGGPKGKKFRYGPFKQLLASLHEKSLEEQKQELDRTFEDWKAEGQQEQIDDVVVIGVRL